MSSCECWVCSVRANIADIHELPNLLRHDDVVVFVDAGYTRDSYK